MIPFSILDLSPIGVGDTVSGALENTRRMAIRAEERGYNRFWLAEHHGMPGIASAATSLVIAHAGHATSRIRIGSGGIMLPNHSPLVIAEQFGTLESLFPGRIDLGLGRAPGTDQMTWRALRRDAMASDQFPQDVLELQALLGPLQPGQRIQAVPGTDTNVPLWILGSSLFGAQLAAVLGLPYAFASHFAPGALMQAVALYREGFKPSAQLNRPHAMAGVNVFAADTDAEAEYLFTSAQQRVIGMIRGQRGQLPPPVEDIDSLWSPDEKAHAARMLACSFVGSAATVRAGLERFIADTGADELIVASAIHDHGKRLRSYEILSGIVSDLRAAA